MVIYLVLFAPATMVFDAVTHWCCHTVLPALTTHLGLDGHDLGDAVIVLLAVLLAASGTSIAFGVVRAGYAVRRLMAAETLGRGPQGSVIVGGSKVVMAAAGYTRPRLVVSVGALAKLDDDELAAGLDHERGHITRRHRRILLAAELFAASAGACPADAWAIRRHERAALARVICKSAMSHLAPSPRYGLLTGEHDVTRRLDELINAPDRVAPDERPEEQRRKSPKSRRSPAPGPRSTAQPIEMATAAGQGPPESGRRAAVARGEDPASATTPRAYYKVSDVPLRSVVHPLGSKRRPKSPAVPRRAGSTAPFPTRRSIKSRANRPLIFRTRSVE